MGKASVASLALLHAGEDCSEGLGTAWGKEDPQHFQCFALKQAAAVAQQHSQIIPQVLVSTAQEAGGRQFSKEEQAGPEARRVERQ